jgi:hypothetical protein
MLFSVSFLLVVSVVFRALASFSVAFLALT